MKQIEAWTTNDGLVFTEKAEASAHEKHMVFLENLHSLIDFSRNYLCYDEVEAITNFIVENDRDLFTLLKDKLED